jgi:hypothetical protein
MVERIRERVGDGPATVFVPISALDKVPLAKLDVWDASGTRLSTLTRHDNERFSCLLLKRAVKGRLGEILDATTESSLGAIVAEEVPLALRRLIDMWEEGEQGRRILEEPLTRELIFMAATTRPMIVPVSVSSERQLVKYSYATSTNLAFKPDFYEDPLGLAPLRGGIWPWIRLRLWALRWWDCWLRFDISRAIFCSSYHFEIGAPEGFGIRDVRVVTPGPLGRHEPLDVRAVAAFPTRANVALSQHNGPEPEDNMRVQCRVRLPRRGLLDFAWVTTFVTMATLIVVGVSAKHLVGVGRSTDAGVAILLALAPLTNLWLGRPEVGKDFGSMLLGLRLLLLISGGAGLVGIALLLAWTSDFCPCWLIASGIAAVAFLGVTVGRFLTGPDPRPSSEVRLQGNSARKGLR